MLTAAVVAWYFDRSMQLIIRDLQIARCCGNTLVVLRFCRNVMYDSYGVTLVVIILTLIRQHARRPRRPNDVLVVGKMQFCRNVQDQQVW